MRKFTSFRGVPLEDLPCTFWNAFNKSLILYSQLILLLWWNPDKPF